MTKHNTTTNSLSKDVEDRNVFELYQLMSRDYDPRAEGADMALLNQVMSMGKHTCKTFDETYAANKKFKKLVDEYSKVCWERPQLEERLKCWALWNMLDKHALAKSRAEAGAQLTCPELRRHPQPPRGAARRVPEHSALQQDRHPRGRGGHGRCCGQVDMASPARRGRGEVHG